MESARDEVWSPFRTRSAAAVLALVPRVNSHNGLTARSQGAKPNTLPLATIHPFFRFHKHCLTDGFDCLQFVLVYAIRPIPSSPTL